MINTRNNIIKAVLPVFFTALCGTVTYPIAVRIARKGFKLKGFYAIHLAIAPFLALVHVNILGVTSMYARIKVIEAEFDRMQPLLKQTNKLDNFRDVNDLRDFMRQSMQSSFNYTQERKPIEKETA